MLNKTQLIVSKTPSEIVDIIFNYIEYMGTGKAEDDGVPEDEMLANVYNKKSGIEFDGFGSSPFLNRERLESYLLKKLSS